MVAVEDDEEEEAVREVDSGDGESAAGFAAAFAPLPVRNGKHRAAPAGFLALPRPGDGGDQRRRLGTSGRRVRLLRRRREPRGEVEIDEHDVAAVLDEHVLRLEVPVHDAEAVQVLKRQHQLRRVKPYDGVGEHLLGLPPAERVEVAAAAPVDGEADDGVGGEDAAQGGEQRVAQRQEHVPLEPDPAVAVAAPAGRLLVARGLPRHRLERHGRLAAAVAVRFPGGGGGGVHDVEHNALGAAPQHGHRLDVLQAQLPRR